MGRLFQELKALAEQNRADIEREVSEHRAKWGRRRAMTLVVSRSLLGDRHGLDPMFMISGMPVRFDAKVQRGTVQVKAIA